MKKLLRILATGLAATLLLIGCQGTAGRSPRAAQITVAEAALPAGGWQGEVAFPDWRGYVDDTLAMNAMYSFKGFHGQGVLYVEPADGVSSFDLFINNAKADTGGMAAGGTYLVDFSGVAADGVNTVQVSNIVPRDLEDAVKVYVPYPVVIDGTLADAGISADVMTTIGDIIESDIAYGFTSAQLAVVKDGRLVYRNAWGKVNSYNKDGSKKTDAPDVTNDTLYDLASNTKMYAVNYALQYLVTHDGFNLDSKIVDLIGERFASDTIEIRYEHYRNYTNPSLEAVKAWKAELTVRDILRHQAGFPADPQYHNNRFNQATQRPDPDVANVLFSGNDGTPDAKAKTLEAICKTPLMYEPGTATVYSDVDYMLLGMIIEERVGKDLNTYLKETFWDPMGLTRVSFRPLDHGFGRDDCAATELNGNTRDGVIFFDNVRTETIQGEVHDEKAHYAMGGVSGHAGLFANATDLAKLASVMLTGGYGNSRFFRQNVMDTFTAPKLESAANWGLGWWREGENQRVWYFGTQSSSGAIGHQGWTGTLTMIDPSTNLVVVYLTNKINSPVTDKESAPNSFDGNYFTASTLGFVPQLIQMGLAGGAMDDALSSLLLEMVSDHFRMIGEEDPPLAGEHPMVQSGYAMVETMVRRARRTGRRSDRELAEQAVEILDDVRDAAKKAELAAALR